MKNRRGQHRRAQLRQRLFLEALEDRTLLTATWNPIGPAPIANGGTAGGLPVSGRITGVATDPSDPNTIYIAAAGGGIWKTTNGGTSWTPLTDNVTSTPTTTVTANIAGISSVTNPFTPPDTNLAVGPNDVVEAVNTAIKITDKTGKTLVPETQFSTFFNTNPNDGYSDPYVLYDAVHQRFVVAILEFSNTTTADLDFAVSNTSDPATGGWTVFNKITKVEENNTFPDFPKMGSNADGVYVSFNQFDNNGFTHDQILTIPWTSILSTGSGGTLPGLLQTDIPTTGSVQAASDWNILIPAHMDDTANGSVAGGPEYYVQSNIVDGVTTTASTITVYTETNTLSANPTFTAHTVNVNPYDASPGVAGLTNQIDSRMLSVDVTNGKLVAAGDVGLSDGLNHARWYELDVSGATPTLLQQGDISPGPGLDTSYPSVAIDPNGNIGMTFIQSGNPNSGPNWQTPSMYVAEHLASDPLNTMETPVEVQAGVLGAAGQGARGGDYSMTVYDPATNSFWAANEFTADSISTDDWGTQIAQFQPGSSQTIPEFMGAVAETDATSGTFNGQQIVYAGTGEANNSGDSFYGEGILVSTNGGSTWTVTNAGGAFNGQTVAKIVIDLSDHTGGTAYAAVDGFGTNGSNGNSGIWKTTNFGQTWTLLTVANTGPFGVNANLDEWSDVVVDPHTPSTLYAAIGNFFGTSDNGIYKSTDGGSTWTLLSGLPHGAGFGRIALAIYDDGTTSELLASFAQPTGGLTGGQLAEMVLSTNGGSSFTQLTNTPNYMGQNGFGQGWYDTTLAIDPNNPNYFYAGGSDNGGSPGNVESFDGGSTWQSIVSDGNGNGPHSDDHAVAFDASGNLIDGNDGGVFKLSNPTNSSTQAWSSLNTNLQITQFTGVAADPTVNNVVYGGSQDNGTEKYTGSSSWNQIAGGDGGITRVDPTHNNIVYQEFTGISLEVSTTGGTNLSDITGGIAANLSNGSPIVNFYAPYVLDASGNVYFGTDFLNFSSNQGTTWSAIGTPKLNGFNPGDAAIDAIAVSPTNNNVVYVSAGGKFFVTTNAQAGGINVTWTEIDLPNGLGASARNSLAVDPSVSNGGTAYAVVSSFQGGGKHVFQTTNFGATWTDISGNLPNTPVDSVAVSPDGKTVYVGTDIGVYSTSNVNGSSTTWASLGTGLPNAQVVELEVVSSQNFLLAGTHGRGAWEISTATAAAPTVTSVSTSTAAGTYGPGSVITIDVNFSENVFVTGKPTLTLNDGETASYQSGNGSSTLVFTYTVAANDTTNGANLDYNSTTALSGTIQNAGGVAANEALPTPASANDTFGTAGIIIDATTPTVTSVSTTTAAGTYGKGAVITIDVNFSENVFVTGKPTLTLNDGAKASYSSGSGTQTLVFTYTVANGDTTNGHNLDYSSINALSGTIKNAGGVAASLKLPTPGSINDTFGTKGIIIRTITLTATTTTAASATVVFNTGTQFVTLTANVTTTAGPVNGGTVTFALMQGNTVIGTATTSGNVHNGQASVSYLLPAGTPTGRYTIGAIYNPISGLAASSDGNQQPLPVLTVTPAATTITASNAKVSYSHGTQTVTLTAQVQSTAGLVNEGTVTFTILQGSKVIGTATTSVTVHNGVATVSYTLPANLPAGYYTIEAVYNPGGDFRGSADLRHLLYVSLA